MLLSAFKILKFDRKGVFFLFQNVLRLHTSFLFVKGDRDFLASAVEIYFKLRNIIHLLLELSQLALEMLLILS